MGDQQRYSDSNNARSTEHLTSSPPHPGQSPEIAQYDARATGHFDPSPFNKERPTSPDVYSPGLHSVMDDEGHKEVYFPSRPKSGRHPGLVDDEGHKEVYFPNRPKSGLRPDLVPGFSGYSTDGKKAGRTHCGLSRLWFFVILIAAIILVLAAGLGVGLVLGLKNNSSSPKSSPDSTQNSEYLIGGAIDPSYYTQTGAFNGSGIALASQSFTSDLESGTQGAIVMYFQHHSGEIRWIQLSSSGEWLGGSPSEIVATDAKNSTPISAVSYSIAGVNTWHIFYVDTNSILRQRSESNTTNVWADGPINDLNLEVYAEGQGGMQACYYGNDYGDRDYKHTPVSGQNTTNGDSAYSNQIGMHMWYASNESTFQQLGWRDGDDSWQHQGEFHGMNGHCGVGCYSWGPTGTVTYAMFVNQENTVEFYWKDTNSSLTSTDKHPINEWVKSPAEIKNANPATSLGYTNYFYAQLEDDLIHGYNVTWNAENTSIDPTSEFVVGSTRGVSGTHVSVSAIPNPGGGNSIVVFYQTEGNDVTEYTRDLIAGQWSSANIPIPKQ